MPKGVAFDNDLLKLIFQATTVTALAQNAAGGLTGLFVALHTADPSAGNQNTSEVAYTSYARVSVARNNTGWTVTGNNCVNANNITFPQCTGGNNTAAFFSIGQNNIGTGGEIYYSGNLTANLTIVNGITPQFGPGNCTISEA